MSILLLGSSGMLGSMIRYVGLRDDRDITCVTRDIFDALTDNIIMIDRYIQTASFVINCIGAIPQKKYTDDEYVKLNTEFPLKLAELCKHQNKPLIHVSTNCVFSGRIPFQTETDLPDASDLYGISKAQGEPKHAMVLRCSIIGIERSSASGLVEWFLHSTRSVFGYIDSLWNGVTTLELARIIFEIIDNRIYHEGIVHIASEPVLSKYELLCMVRDIWNKQVEIFPKENGLKHYTLQSTFLQKPIHEQLIELHSIEEEYRMF